MNPLSYWSDLSFDDSLEEFDVHQLLSPGGAAIRFDDPRLSFASPDDRSRLTWSNGSFLSANGFSFPAFSGRPALLPNRALQFCTSEGLKIPPERWSDGLLQYLYLGIVKGTAGEANSPLSDIWYRRHLKRSSLLVRDAYGVVCDVGCDDPRLSRSLFPSTASYVGLDPSFGERSDASLIAMAEFMPFSNESVDAVSFLTSLDHILDYKTAINEAHRILKPGGALYIATLIWTADAELVKDNIHFHHFRAFEIEGALNGFKIESVQRYNWKNDTHRSGAYIKASKPTKGG